MSPAASAGRHWKIALCSLSIGTMQAPPSRAAAISSSPASNSGYLLASSRRLPARAAARVESRPAAPTLEETTISAEQGVGQECVRTCKSRWHHVPKKTITQNDAVRQFMKHHNLEL